MNNFKRNGLYLSLAACGLMSASAAWSVPLSLAQSPAGSVAVAPPPPNLILTIDNSDSMNNRTPDTGQVGSRMQNLRSALQAAFSAANVPEGAIRLGWNTINPQAGSSKWGLAEPGDCSEFRTSSTVNYCGAQGNIVRPLTNAHRANFINWVGAGLKGTGATPTIHGYNNALKQYDIPAANANSPWAEVPGTSAGSYISCRKSYVMLLTDGDYNRFDSAGVLLGGSPDLDSVPRVLGDGVTNYDPTQPYANIYKQTQDQTFTATNHLQVTGQLTNFNTLSDLAFHYWAKDSDGNSANNNVKPDMRVNAAENGISSFWNPKNNPATWQHVSTYTIGYGATASGWTLSPKLVGTETLANSVDLQRLMSGALSWPHQNRNQIRIQQEMMHAAINGRGKFYPAKTQQDLIDAIKDMLSDVIQVPERHVTSAIGSSLSSFADSSAFFTTYDSDKWSGDVGAATLLAAGGVAATGPWGTNTAASLLATNPNRHIWTSKTVAGVFSGESFSWANLGADQQTALRGTATIDATTTQLGQDRLDYVKGVRTKEGSPFRQRASLLGDIVNSKVWFMKGVPNGGYLSADYLSFVATQKALSRKDAVYVGANDGMLHAFDAANGQELFAYVPQGAYSGLASLSDSAYAHRYFVDGSPFTADYCKNPTPTGCAAADWSTALVGFMGAGGKGYFVLDVTSPTAMAANKVVMDTTATVDPDIGYIFQEPVTEKSNPMASRQVVRMNNGKWALVIGNGYNSTDEKAVLIIQYLDGTVTKIYADATAGGGNGLSAPRLIDLNGDFRPDVAYAGDLKGNLYKFDIASAVEGNWKVAGGGAMFKAVSSTNVVQPITSAPAYTIHPGGGLVVTFGTGQNLTIADRSDTTTQSFYGVYDNGFTYVNENAGGVTVTAPADKTKTAWGMPWTRANNMVAQAMTVSGDGWTTDSSTTKDADGDGVVDDDFADVIGTTERGWFMDLPSKERVLKNPTWFDGELMYLFSEVPASAPISPDPCLAEPTTPASYFVTVLNGATGNKPKTPDLFAGYASDVNRVPTDRAMVRTSNNTRDRGTCVGGECEEPPVDGALGLRYFKVPSWREMQ